jgi:hypothetical protein
MELAQDRVQWQIFLLAVFEASGSVTLLSVYTITAGTKRQRIVTEMSTGRSAVSDTDTGLYLWSTDIYELCFASHSVYDMFVQSLSLKITFEKLIIRIYITPHIFINSSVTKADR